MYQNVENVLRFFLNVYMMNTEILMGVLNEDFHLHY